MKNPKGKGNGYEREICATFSRWWAGDDNTEDLFWRTASSGGRATQRKARRTYNQHGDMCAIHPSAEPFIDVCTVEIKRGYNTRTIAELFDTSPNSARKLWEEWLCKAEASSRAAGSFAWMIISRRNMCEATVTMPLRLFGELAEYEPFEQACRWPTYQATVNPRDKKKRPAGPMVIVGLDFRLFLQHTDPQWFVELSKRL